MGNPNSNTSADRFAIRYIRYQIMKIFFSEIIIHLEISFIFHFDIVIIFNIHIFFKKLSFADLIILRPDLPWVRTKTEQQSISADRTFPRELEQRWLQYRPHNRLHMLHYKLLALHLQLLSDLHWKIIHFFTIHDSLIRFVIYHCTCCHPKRYSCCCKAGRG